MRSLSSGDASDSICPKGWGIARYDGDGSYERLNINIYPAHKTNKVYTSDYKEFDFSSYINNHLRSMPLSQYFYGLFDYFTGSISHTLTNTYLWQNKVANTSSGTLLYFRTGYFNEFYSENKKYGFSVRCVAKSQN